MQKGENCAFKGGINQKKSCTDGKNPTKELKFGVTNHFKSLNQKQMVK